MRTTSPPGWRRRGPALAVVLAVLVAPMAACTDDEPDEGEGRLRVEDGSALVVRQDGDREEVDDGTRLHTGDEVTLREGTGTIDLGGEPTLELRAGVASRADTVVVMGPRPVLEAGDLLVVSPGRFAVSADDAVIEVVEGAARISRAAGLEVASYDAQVRLSSAGQDRDVPALREVQVPSPGLVPERPSPFEYDEDDAWDRRYLGEANELSERLDALSVGYSQNLGAGSGRTVAFFRDVLPGLVDEPELTADLLVRGLAAGETLVGAAIVDLGQRGTFAERWRSVFEFRGEGAAWGIVALDQGVDGPSLLDAVTRAVESTELALAPPPRGGAGGTGSTGGADGGGGTGGGAPPGTRTPTTRPGRPTTTTTQPPVEEKSEGLLPPLLGPIVDPVADLLSGLVDGLLGGLFAAGR